MDPRLFRKAAIDRMSSPEELDALIRVTSPRGWLALLTLGIVLAGAVLWSVLGSIPTRVEGRGILLPGEGLRQITSSGEGVLTELDIAENLMVEPGQFVGRIDRPDIEDQIRSAERAHRDLQNAYEVAQAESLGRIGDVEADILNMQADIEETEGLRTAAEAELRRYEAGLQEGLYTERDVTAIRSQVANHSAQITRYESSITRLRGQIDSTNQALRQQKLLVDQVEREADDLRSQGARVSDVSSTVSGRVIQVLKREGDTVSYGETIAVVEPSSGGTVVLPVFFVDSSQGARIEIGMSAEISPTTVQKQEFGFLRGTVTDREEYPTGAEAAIEELGIDPDTARDMLGGGSYIEVRAELANADTVSGFEWSSPGGPPHRIAAGELITVSIIVERRAPVTYLLPKIREVFGIS